MIGLDFSHGCSCTNTHTHHLFPPENWQSSFHGKGLTQRHQPFSMGEGISSSEVIYSVALPKCWGCLALRKICMRVGKSGEAGNLGWAVCTVWRYPINLPLLTLTWGRIFWLWALCGADCTLTLSSSLRGWGFLHLFLWSSCPYPLSMFQKFVRVGWNLSFVGNYSPVLFYSGFLFVLLYFYWGVGILGRTGAGPFAWCAFWTGSITRDRFHPKVQSCQAGVSFLCHGRQRGSVWLSNWS